MDFCSTGNNQLLPKRAGHAFFLSLRGNEFSCPNVQGMLFFCLYGETELRERFIISHPNVDDFGRFWPVFESFFLVGCPLQL